MSDPHEDIDKLTAAIAGLEAQRATLGEGVVAPAVAALREQLSRIEASARGPMEDERKLVTIVFADISGFTALSEQMDAEDVRTIMNGCFDFLVPVVTRYEGTIDKFIGDEIMAVFGAPAAHENDPERALRVALEMMDALAAFNLKHGTRLGLHIGINTGPVVAGRVGAHDRGDYSVLGDAVNLAARLEDASSSGEIFVGRNTYRQTKRLFDFESLPPLHLKGKEAPVEAYRLLGLKAVPAAARGIEGLRAPLTGRGSELEELRSTLTALRSGRGCLLTITGEAGLGKSRLIAEAQALSASDVSWSVGRALPHTAGMSYWVARDLLYNLLEVKPDAPPAHIDRVLRRAIEGELQDVQDVYPYLARLLELPMEPVTQERVHFLTGAALQERLLQAFRVYVGARARRQPLVLVWEDLHWCDPSSLRVFEALLPLTRSSPLLLLSATRPDETVATDLLGRARHAHAAAFRSIELSPLTRTESESLIRDLLKIETLPEKARDLIVGRAEGNPFFLEELLRSLLDAGHIRREKGGVAVADRIDTVDVPETVQGVLMARLDRLPPDHKRALQRAAVLGRHFQARVLAHLYGDHSPAVRWLDRSLTELQRGGFIQSHGGEASGAPDEYGFKHAITHHVAYHSLLVAHRKELHRLAARAMERLFPDRLEELSATLGYHYERAAMPEPAARHLGRAAERAQATFANTEALAYYRSAIAQTESIEGSDRDERIQSLGARLNEGMGDVLTLVGRHGEARAAFEQALSVIAAANATWRSRLFRKIGFSHDLQRHYRETGAALDAAEEQLGVEEGERPAEWWEEKVQIQLERMHLLYWQGMAGEMRELASRYRSAIQERGTPIQRGKFFEKLALSYLTESRYQPDEECLRLAELASSESRGSDSLPEVAHIRFVLGFVHLWRGNFAEAAEHCAATLRLAERFGDLVIQARSLTYLAVAHRCAQELDQARTRAVQTLELATRIGMSEYVAMAQANLAWVAWREGDHAQTEKRGGEALRLWHDMDDPYGFDWMALLPLIATRLAQDDINGAMEHTKALLGPKQHPLPETLALATRRVLASWQRGEGKVARDELAQVIQTAHEAGYL